MVHNLSFLARSLPLVALTMILAMGDALVTRPAEAAALADGPLVTIDAPAGGATFTEGQTIRVSGWAADPSGTGTGINRVDVYLDRRPGVQGTSIGTATYGIDRPDVASAYGRSDWTRAGFVFEWTPQSLTEGDHVVQVEARSDTGSTGVQSVSVTIARQPGRYDARAGSRADSQPGGLSSNAYGYGSSANYSGYGGGYGGYPSLGSYGGYEGYPYYGGYRGGYGGYRSPYYGGFGGYGGYGRYSSPYYGGFGGYGGYGGYSRYSSPYYGGFGGYGGYGFGGYR